MILLNKCDEQIAKRLTKTSAEIAKELNLNTRYVEKRLEFLFIDLNVGNRPSAILRLIESGWPVSSFEINEIGRPTRKCYLKEK